MNKNDFFDQYKDPRWQKKRLEIMKRDKFMCKKCRDNKSTLNVHHKRYIRDTKPWEYNNKDLITLCEFCHQMLGSGENRLDVDKFSIIHFIGNEFSMKAMKYPGRDSIIVVGIKDNWNYYCVTDIEISKLVNFLKNG